MKKILLILAIIIAGVTGAEARDNYSRNANDLPVAARNVLKRNFKAGISLIKIDKEFGRISDFEVTLADGSEVKFDRNGNWEEVEVSAVQSVPAEFVPKSVAAFVKAKHQGKRIVGIDKDRNGYEVTLSDGIEMKFDKTGKFIEYD